MLSGIVLTRVQVRLDADSTKSFNLVLTLRNIKSSPRMSSSEPGLVVMIILLGYTVMFSDCMVG